VLNLKFAATDPAGSRKFPLDFDVGSSLQDMLLEQEELTHDDSP
jgi:hypothetical protein